MTRKIVLNGRRDINLGVVFDLSFASFCTSRLCSLFGFSKTLKKGSHLEKLVSLEIIGHTWKNRSHLANWDTLRKMGLHLEKWVTIGKMGPIW